MKAPKPKLRDIWKNLFNEKFKKGFIKYLASLDYEEFDEIFDHFITTTYRLRLKYKNTKIKFLSEKWFKSKIVLYKYDEMFRLFGVANLEFIKKSNSILDEKNKKKTNLIKNINEKRQILNALSQIPLVITTNSTQSDILKFYIAIISNIYNSNELVKSLEELNNLK
jgi:hypothetical protein